MNRAEKRKETFRVIENRKKKIKSWHGFDVDDEETNCRSGDLKNNNKMNAYACRTGTAEEKTNWKKRHSKYRAKQGGYGKAMCWCKHDATQLEDMSIQEEEWRDEE